MAGAMQVQWSTKLLLLLDSDSVPTNCPGETNRVIFFSKILQRNSEIHLNRMFDFYNRTNRSNAFMDE